MRRMAYNLYISISKYEQSAREAHDLYSSYPVEKNINNLAYEAHGFYLYISTRKCEQSSSRGSWLVFCISVYFDRES